MFLSTLNFNNSLFIKLYVLYQFVCVVKILYYRNGYMEFIFFTKHFVKWMFAIYRQEKENGTEPEFTLVVKF